MIYIKSYQEIKDKSKKIESKYNLTLYIYTHTRKKKEKERKEKWIFCQKFCPWNCIGVHIYKYNNTDGKYICSLIWSHI